MRLFAVCLSCLFAALAQGNTALDALKGDSDKAVYCFYASSLQMQFQGAMATDRSRAAELMQSAQRWQNLVERLAEDPAAQMRAMQHATTDLNQRMQAAGPDPASMRNKVLTPTMTVCNALLARLDAPVTAQPQPAPAAPAPQTPQTGPFDADVFAGLLSSPLRGKFRWNMHSTVYADVKTAGVLTRSAEQPAMFQVAFDSKISTLCVGNLVESSRSEDGYLMHLSVKPGAGEGCKPQVTRGLLYPLTLDEQYSSRRVMLRLYDDAGRLITASLFNSKALGSKRLDQKKLLAMNDIVQRMDADNDNARRGAKFAKLSGNPDFVRLEPFYNSCMTQAPAIPGVEEPRDYCICMTYKFGVGGRIPEPEFASYTRNFSRLVERSSVFTNDNKLYTRLAETCRRCSSPSAALHPRCDEMDTALLMPINFAEMIQRLEQPIVQLETTTFYKENFFVIYLQGYSNVCSAELENPVPFEYVVTEYTTDPYAGTFANEVQRTRTNVARKHAPRYKAIYDKHSKLSPEQFGAALRSMAITSDAELRRSQSDLQARISSETEKRVSVREHLANGCRTESVQRVYSNLDALFN
ncbi:MAG: hypothetical protein AB8B93_04925 [Pseudomonadales bacterium]